MDMIFLGITVGRIQYWIRWGLKHYALWIFPSAIVKSILSCALYRLGVGCGGNVLHSGEYVVFRIIKNFANGGQITVFDVGANQGQYTDAVKKYLRKPLIIHAFEPSDYSFQAYTKTHLPDDRIILNKLALSDSLTSATLYFDEPGSGLASLAKRELQEFNIDHAKHAETVELKTLDDYTRENGIERIDLLKIDVEGWEYKVLLGAIDSFKSNKISFVQFEFGGCNIDTRTYFRDFYRFLETFSFKIYRILPYGKLLPIDRYSEKEELFQTMNYLCVNQVQIDCGRLELYK